MSRTGRGRNKTDSATGAETRLPAPSEAEQERVHLNAVLHRYDREKPTLGRVTALNLLHQKMVANAKLYQGDLQDKRDAITTQMLAIVEYLSSQGFALATLEPVMHPVSALVERELNRLDPVFAERLGGGRPKRSLVEESRTGALVAISEVWLRSLAADERTQKLKLAELARKISGGWFGRLSGATIKGAREIVSQEAKGHPAVSWAEFYREHLAEAELRFSPWASIQIVVHSLNRQYPKN